MSNGLKTNLESNSHALAVSRGKHSRQIKGKAVPCCTDMTKNPEPQWLKTIRSYLLCRSHVYCRSAGDPS